jgi:hypothetical protein
MSEIILDDSAVAFVAHACKGQPIYICFGTGDHSVYRKKITPQRALDIASDLIQFARTELDGS